MRGDGFTAAHYIGSAGLYPRSDLAGLNLAQIPAALVECANMRNPQEAALISTPQGRARYATAIADGIMAWLTSRPAPYHPPVPRSFTTDALDWLRMTCPALDLSLAAPVPAWPTGWLDEKPNKCGTRTDG